MRGHLSQCADGKNLALFVDGLAGGKIVPKLVQHRRRTVREGVMALGTEFSAAKLEGGRASSGATLACVSVVPGAGFVATIIATASSVAALAEL